MIGFARHAPALLQNTMSELPKGTPQEPSVLSSHRDT
jgi:hypothetical protein